MQSLLNRFSIPTLQALLGSQRLLWSIVFALLVALGFAASTSLMQGLGSYLEARAPAAAPAQGAGSGPAPRSRKPITAFDPILKVNAFHARRGEAAAGPATPNTPAAASALRITLTGIYIAEGAGYAFIAGADGRSELVYKVGECVPRAGELPVTACDAAQGRLTKVEAQRIVVMFAGQPTVFTLERPQAAEPGAPTPVAAQPAAAAAQPVPPPPTPPGGSPFASVRNGSNIQMHLPTAEVEKAFENFSDIVKQARVVPFTKDGATLGFQIQQIQPGSVFQRIGLQNLDIIKGVNGQALNTADQALRLFTVFRNERDVVLDVQRQEENIRLSYSID
jgi:general secretion pathway protein C